jgi:hypothetical protein
MKVRSPVLGYNHNVRYAERLWHVQTEDSGVQNPHIFTHLFHDGTILATKRLDYDPSSEVVAVQKLMQTQHKSMLRELKAGAFDDKIAKFLGHPVVRKEALSPSPSDDPPSNPDATPSGVELAEPRPLTGPDEPFDEPPTDRTSGLTLDTDRDLGEAVPQAAAPPPSGDTDRKLTVPPASRPNISPLRPGALTPGQPPPSLPPLRPPVRPPTGQVPQQAPPQASGARTPAARPGAQRPPSSFNVQRSAPSGIGGRRAAGSAGSYGSGAKPTAEGVVVARPAVIIGGDSSRRPDGPQRPGASGKPAPKGGGGRWHQPSSPTGNPPPAAAQPPIAGDKGGQDNIFGGDLISEKSLDEVILAYLSEDLNDK